jgi:predicted dehydrogenase
MVLNAAVVGGGTVSRRHLTGLKNDPLVELKAICDIDESRAQTLAEEYDITPYADIGAMLDAESLDWVHICTSVQTHRDLAIQAMEAGCHVLIEKPVSLTAAEVDDIERASEEHGVRVSVVRNHLFGFIVREVQDRIAAGELGKLRAVEVVYTGNTPPDESNRGAWTFELPGGEFEEGIPHPIYTALGIGGLPASDRDAYATTACSKQYDQGFTYDGLQIGWTTPDEVLCSVTVTAGAVPQRTVNVHGEKASLSVDMLSQTMVTLDKNYNAGAVNRARSNVDHIVGRTVGTLSNVFAMAKRRLGDDDWEDQLYWDSHYHQYHLEAEAILYGREPPVPIEQAKWTMKLIELIREHAENRGAADEADQQLAGRQEPTLD